MMASTAKQDLIFQPQHRLALSNLLQPAQDKCQQLCSALHITYKIGGAKTTNEDLFPKVIKDIINNKVSKSELAAALESVGYGNLAQEFEANKSIKDNHDGVLDQVNEITGALAGAAPKCSDLARKFGLNPGAAVTVADDDFNLMLDQIVDSGKITQETLACALENQLVKHGMLALKIRRFNFSGVIAGGATTSSAQLPQSGQSSTGGHVPATTATAVGASAAVTNGQSGFQAGGATISSATLPPSGPITTTTTVGAAAAVTSVQGGSQDAESPKYKKLSEFSKAEHKVRRVVCNEVFEEHLKNYLDKIGMDFQELKETYMDKAFQKAVYDYSDVEVECDSLHESPPVVDEVGYSFEWPNTTDADESHVYDKEINYGVGNELTVTNSSEWSICGGLSATYQGVGATANIGYTKRQSEVIKKIKNRIDKYRVTETVTVPPRSKVKVAVVQNYQKKECKVKNVKLTFPKNAEVTCKAKNRQTKSDKVEKPEYPIREVLKDFIEDQDADPLTARLDGKYVWVETGLALNKGEPEPI